MPQRMPSASPAGCPPPEPSVRASRRRRGRRPASEAVPAAGRLGRIGQATAAAGTFGAIEGGGRELVDQMTDDQDGIDAEAILGGALRGGGMGALFGGGGAALAEGGSYVAGRLSQ